MAKSEKETVVNESENTAGETQATKVEKSKVKEKMITRTFNTHTVTASKIEVGENGSPVFKDVEPIVLEQEQMNETKALFELSKVYGAGSYFVSKIETSSKTYELAVSKYLEIATEVIKETN